MRVCRLFTIEHVGAAFGAHGGARRCGLGRPSCPRGSDGAMLAGFVAAEPEHPVVRMSP